MIRLGAAIARRLPGTWRSTHLDLHDPAVRTDLLDRLRDQGIAQWALLDFVQPDGGCLLTGPSEQQLLLLRRPLAQHRRAPYVVSALAPGWAVEHAQERGKANGITVPADPVHAAVLIARRLLPRYDDEIHAWEQGATADDWQQALTLHKRRSGSTWRQTAVAGQRPTAHSSPSGRPPARSR